MIQEHIYICILTHDSDRPDATVNREHKNSPLITKYQQNKEYGNFLGLMMMVVVVFKKSKYL